jgi:ABC-2 type transport system permease protein
MIVGQFFFGVGTVLGLGFVVPRIDSESALYLSTGAPALSLISLGLVLVPQLVATSRIEGSFEYMRSLPAPRMAYFAADLTVWMLATMPNVALAVYVGSAHYGFDLQISPLALPAFLLIGLTATNVGYAIALATPKAEAVGVITNVIVFSLFLFSPINFPVERLPDWLATLHHGLPAMHAADVVRGTLTDVYDKDLTLGFTVLGAWCILGFAVNYVVMHRRG